MSRRKHNLQPTVALEVTRTHLLATIIRVPAGAAGPVVRCRQIKWRNAAVSLATPAGASEFTAALKQLATEEKLSGCEAGICLNEEFCVTRVVTGATDRVRRELSQLEERTSLYLTLGAGPKTHARSVRQVDARHQHALLTVTNKKVLDTIMAAAREAGLAVSLVEPVLVALARTVNRLQRDLDRPVVLVNLSRESFELGISYQGQLLLDYRPGGKSAQNGVAEIVHHHLARLDRYCQRYFQIPSGSLCEIFLCGGAEEVERAKLNFSSDPRLRVEPLPLDELSEIWAFDGSEAKTPFSALLGTQLALQKLSTDALGPNFMERIRAETRQPLLPALMRSAWPIAAALLLSLILTGLGVMKQATVEELSAQLKTLEPSAQKISQWRMKQITADKKTKYLTAIAKKLDRPDWQEMVATVGHCLPDDVWLETITIQSDGKMQLTGAAYGEGGIYEFIRYLKDYPSLTQVALEQTTPTNLASGPATKFDLNCDLTGHAGQAKQEKKP
ncbi:MAG TPA: PilN domain-containing protein [Pirellulales bacterium]|jgi:Tfp pilus assembly protein PilN|nr:PilN domain-containing protein [Pirellulales bacterium]